MQETPVIVVIEVVSVEDAKGLKVYQERASELIGPLGGLMLGQGGSPVDGSLVLLLSRFNVGPLKALSAPGWPAKPTNLFVKFGSRAPQ
jgi:hypothetical protein